DRSARSDADTSGTARSDSDAAAPHAARARDAGIRGDAEDERLGTAVMRHVRLRDSRWIAALLLAAGGAAPIGAQTPHTPFPLPTPVRNPFTIVSGSDGNLWFTETNANNIGRITTAGVITEFPLSAPSTYIAAEPGAIWFTTAGLGKVDLTKTTGCESNPTQCITVYPGVGGQGIAFTPDGGIWLNGGNGVARADKANPSQGTTVLYPTVEHVTTTYGVTLGSDGNIWFIELDRYNSNPDHTGRIAKIDIHKLSGCDTAPTKCITEYPVPGGNV